MMRRVVIVLLGTFGLMLSAWIIDNRPAVGQTYTGPCNSVPGGGCWCKCQDCTVNPKIYSFCTGYQWASYICQNNSMYPSCTLYADQCMTNLSTTFTYCTGDA